MRHVKSSRKIALKTQKFLTIYQQYQRAKSSLQTWLTLQTFPFWVFLFHFFFSETTHMLTHTNLLILYCRTLLLELKPDNILISSRPDEVCWYQIPVKYSFSKFGFIIQNLTQFYVYICIFNLTNINLVLCVSKLSLILQISIKFFVFLNYL